MSKCQVVEDMGFFLVSSINYFIVVRRMLNVFVMLLALTSMRT